MHPTEQQQQFMDSGTITGQIGGALDEYKTYEKHLRSLGNPAKTVKAIALEAAVNVGYAQSPVQLVDDAEIIYQWLIKPDKEENTCK